MRLAARVLPFVLTSLSALVVALPAVAQAPVTYRVSFPAPEHHYAQIEVTFPNLPAGTLEARMSRSSPGRYALHEYAKNVFELQAFDGKGKTLAATRPNPYQWDVNGHDGTVRIVYKIYGDHVDGTYLGIDADARAHEHAGDADVGARPRSPQCARHVRAAEGPVVGSRDAAVSDRRSLDVYRAEPAVPDGQPDRAERANDSDVQGARRRWPAIDDQGRDPSRCRRGRSERVRCRCREDRAGAGSRVRRVSGVRARTLHVSRGLRALGWRRWDGAPQQHGRRRTGLAAHARHGRRRARHGVARVLPRLERGAHPAEDARAVQFRRSEHLG